MPRISKVRLATRGSALALTQAGLAARALAARHPEHEFVLTPLETAGDRAGGMSLTDAPQEGIFVKELEQALLDGRAELAVHSAKDLPTVSTAGLVLSAYLPRADPRDVLIGREGVSLDRLPRGARVGTGSPRRSAQLKAVRPDLSLVPIRGNVDTRLNRLREGAVDALVLAAAGLQRLNRLDEVHDWISLERMVPAPGQGALAIQAVLGSPAAQLAAAVDDPGTRRAVQAERAVLRGLGGGCLSAVGAYAALEEGELVLHAVVLTEDGSSLTRATARGPRDEGVVADVLRQLRAGGATELLGRPAPGRPLQGMRVMVTRAIEQAGNFVRALQDAGATVVLCPVIAIEELAVEPAVLAGLDSYDWVIFTSVNAVDRFFGLLAEARRRLPAVRLAAIGPETAARLRAFGVTAEVVPARFVAEDLADALPDSLVRGKRILLPRAQGARDVLPQRLRGQGATVDVVEIYRAVPPPSLPARLNQHLRGGVDLVTFTSSSTVRHFIAALGAGRLPAGVRVACIGPITAETARGLGLPVDIIADEYTARGLLDAIVRRR